MQLRREKRGVRGFGFAFAVYVREHAIGIIL